MHSSLNPTLVVIQHMRSHHADHPRQCVVAEIPDSDSEFNRDLAAAQGVSSYPTIKFYPRDGSSPIPYSGARNEEGFVNVSPEEVACHNFLTTHNISS